VDFASVTGIASLIITFFIFVGIIWFFIRARPRKEVLFLRPRDRRGERLIITKETDRSIVCGRSNPVKRFIKIGPGYAFNEGGKMVTRFWGIEGLAYTAGLEGDDPVKMSIPEYLRVVWGKRFYESVPPKQRAAIERDHIGVIIEPVPIKPPGFRHLTSEDIDDEADAVILSRIAKATTISTKREFYQLMVGVIIGIGLAALMLRLGWL